MSTTTTIRSQPPNPKLKHLVYSKYRELLGTYNDKANTIIESLPDYMVKRDEGFNIICIDDINSRNHNVDQVDNYSSNDRHGQQPPACVQNAMMTKDKKPFSYTPGGIDLSEIKSPRMAKRIAHNAQLEGAGGQHTKPSPLAQPNATHQPSMAAQAMGMPVQVFPTGPPPPPPIPSGGPPPPPPPSKNHLAPQGAAARKSPSPQNFEPPPMGCRPEIKIPPNPMATLKKVPKPKEKNDFWVDEYRKERSKSPIPGFNEQMTLHDNDTPHAGTQNFQESQSPQSAQSYPQQYDFAREQEAERRRQQQMQQQEEERRKQLERHEEQRRLMKQQEDQRRQQIQQQQQEEELRRQQQQKAQQQAAMQSPGIDQNRGQTNLRSPAVLQAQQTDANRAQSPLRSPAIAQTQQQEFTRGASPMKSPAIQQIQNQYQQQLRASQSPQRTFPFSNQPVRVDSPMQSPEHQPNIQRAQSPGRINTQQTPIYTRNQGVTSPTQSHEFNQQPNRNVGSIYIPPVEAENLKAAQAAENQQRKGPPPNRWVSVQPSKDPPAWAMQNNNQQQQPQQHKTVPSQQTPFTSSTPQHHMQPNLKLQINSNLSGSSNPREHIIPIQLEQTPTPTRTPSTPGFGPQPFNSNQQYSSVPSPGSNGSGYVMRNPNQFVDQGYNNYPEDPNRVRSPSSVNNGSRIIPIGMEGQERGPFNPNSVRGPINQTPMVIKNDPRILQHQNSWNNHNNINNGPNQSKSFRILQKITDTEDNTGLTATNQNNNIYNNYNNINKINNNRQINDSNQSNAAQRTNYSQQINNNNINGGYNDNNNYDTTEQLRRMHINNNNSYPGTPIIIHQPPCYVQLQHPIYFNQDQSQQQTYIHPSEQQPLPEPKIYTGSAIPSRSFKILQAMTTPENAAELEGSDVIEYEQISNSMPYFPPPYPPYPYGYPYAYPYGYPPIHHPPYPYYPGYPINFSNPQSVECDSVQNLDENFYYPGVVRRRKSLTNNRNQYNNNGSQESLDTYNPSWRYSAPPNIIVTESFDEKEEDEVNAVTEKAEEKNEQQSEEGLNKFGIKEGSLAKLQQAFECKAKGSNDNINFEAKTPLKKQISLQENYIEDNYANPYAFNVAPDCRRSVRAGSVTRSFSDKYDLNRKIRAKSVPRKPESDTYELRRNLRAGSVNRSLKSIEIPEIPRFIREGSLTRNYESVPSEVSRNTREGSVLDMLSEKLNEINKSDTLTKNTIQDHDEKHYVGEKSKEVNENHDTDYFANYQKNYVNNEAITDFKKYSSSSESESEDEDDDEEDDLELESNDEDIKNNLTKIKSIKSVANIQVYNKNQKHIAIEDNTSVEGNSSIFEDETNDEDDEIKSQIFEDEITEEIEEADESDTESEEVPRELDEDDEDEIIIEDDLSIILEESEHHDKDLKRTEKLCPFHERNNESESSNTIENNLDEDEPKNDENLVTVRLPLKLSFSRSSNDENVTTVEIGNSEIEDQSRSFSVASIQDDDEDSDTDMDDMDDCDISVTISLSSSRSGSVDYRNLCLKQTSVDEIKENSESDVSVSFSLNMRDKFLKETYCGDTTNNIAEYNEENSVFQGSTNVYESSSLMKNEDFWAAIKETEPDEGKKPEENYKEFSSDNNTAENKNLEKDFWADIADSSEKNLEDDFWAEIKCSNQRNLDELNAETEKQNAAQDEHIYESTDIEKTENCDDDEPDVDFWAEITKTERKNNFGTQDTKYSDFYKTEPQIENGFELDIEQQSISLPVDNKKSIELEDDKTSIVGENVTNEENECAMDVVDSSYSNINYVEDISTKNYYHEKAPLTSSTELITSNDKSNVTPCSENEKELESEEFPMLISKQIAQITQNSLDNTNLSRTSSIQRSESELEEDDSGVTDMNRLVSETDTESECFPELKKMTRYQRASTHSRLFKLLQNDGSTEDQSDNSPDDFEFRPSKKKIIHNVSITRRQNPNAIKYAESMEERRERLSLPLKLSTSIDSDNLSTSNSPLSPSSHSGGDVTQSKSKVNDQLVNELVQSLLLKKNSEQFKNLPMEKLQAAAKRVLEEELDSLEGCSVESTPAPTPQEFKTDLYSEYYDSWKANSQNPTELSKDFELIPSKAFKNLQEQSILGSSNKKKPWSFKCPRVLSSKTINRDLARVTESPEISRNLSNNRSSCERDSDINNSNNIGYRKDNYNKHNRKV